MKTTPTQLSVIGLVICSMFTGCVSMNKPTKVSTAERRFVVIVPVRGEPVTVVSQHLGTSLTLGLVGGAVEQAAAGNAREELASRMNRDAHHFNPELILAEECASLLKGSAALGIETVALQRESVLMPEEQKLLAGETAPFKARRTNRVTWLGLYNDWRKGPAVPVSAAAHGAVGHFLCLEVRFQMLELNHGNEVDAAALVRLIDPTTQKVLGARYVGDASYDIRPVTLQSEVTAFEEDFRKLARQLAKDALSGMKLL